MNFENPTSIRVGMVGMFSGKRYRVAGRVVLGMEEAGTTYYWNEFNLVNMEGERATLVCERGEQGLEWRLFTLFEPGQPLTAAEASRQRVRDQIQIDGTSARVTLVDQSRVYHIEGQAPEGVELGDVADYFNAESGNRMIVVSWTGDEVEYYRGMDLSAAAVMSAFNLPAQKGQSRLAPLQSYTTSSKVTKIVVTAFVVGVIALVCYATFRTHKSPVKIIQAKKPVPTLALGGKGRLHDKEFRVVAHALVEISQVGARFQRHEYQLSVEGEVGKPLLIYGFTPTNRNWFLFFPIQPEQPIDPMQAAALPGGKTVELQGPPARITEIFQSTLRKAETVESSDLKTGTMQYGFVARSASTVFLVRWTESEITCYAGNPFPSKQIAEAFKGKQP